MALDNKLNFPTQLLNITKNVNKKFNAFNALTRVQKHMTPDKKTLIFSSLIKSKFTYYPSILTLCPNRSFRRIKNIHERCLHLIQQNYKSDFQKLSENANDKSVHQKCV